MTEGRIFAAAEIHRESACLQAMAPTPDFPIGGLCLVGIPDIGSPLQPFCPHNEPPYISITIYSIYS
jgi:hypothetical protein